MGEVVQPLISRARRSECEKCLSRKQLQVLLLIPIEVLGDKFEKEYPSEEFDKVAWKQFFNKNAKFQTLCLNCIQQKNELEKQKAARMNRGVNVLDSDDDDNDDESVAWAKKRLKLNAASKALAIRWLRMARAHKQAGGIRAVRARETLAGGRTGS